MYTPKKLPEVHDLVSVEIKGVDYYGYISEIDFDWSLPIIKVQFHPNHEGLWYDLSECKPVDFPKCKT